MLFYQDFNEQFEGYTQRWSQQHQARDCCFIRMSMNNLKDIHNSASCFSFSALLFYQDVNEQFEGYTQPSSCDIIVIYVVLSGCQ